MGATKKRTLQAAQVEDDDEDILAQLGKQLLGTQKMSKDAVMKALRVGLNLVWSSLLHLIFKLAPLTIVYSPPQAASRILEDAPQSSDELRIASANLCTALAKPDGYLKHKDKVS